MWIVDWEPVLGVADARRAGARHKRTGVTTDADGKSRPLRLRRRARRADGPDVRYRQAIASWDDVSRLALSLPQAREERRRELLFWSVRDRLFVWERPLRKSDLRALGDAAPSGPILGARVEHLVAKEALLADDPDVYFTTPHFDGYAAILVRLERIGLEGLEELVVEAWLAVAPPRLVREYLEARGGGLSGRPSRG